MLFPLRYSPCFPPYIPAINLREEGNDEKKGGEIVVYPAMMRTTHPTRNTSESVAR